MLANLNRQLFEATVFDSGALGLTTSIVHQFTVAGVYSATVRKDGKHMGNVSFEVRDDATSMQLDIDLAKTQQGSKDGCCCGTEAGQPVSSKGYVVFHTTSGTGWSVHVGEGKQASFDSTRLTKGDIFALTLLEPTRYGIENKLGSAKGSVTVEFSKGDAKRLSELKPVMVTAGKKFDPENFKLIATQGLVFRIETDARIVISRKEARKAEPDKGRIRFQRPRIVETRPARKAS
ncbi:hypothetical protein SAMN04515648_4164 [Phyllobacterium sp. CL33Tsu]|uniref:hypothetical protein n=1 Tax=Phyllobacterium sp. CL33Tsu TaxID=1798191 RepID=UPI0008E35FE0|nr:hypothetical protein [Phyllobacterium sp. CL33Tsu]SFJ46150.1 hypothetical protein SAMN04515648_4164 [Phyllobacterium sp. CL33Tsu]